MSAGRKRTTDRHYSAEDQALDQISKEAEERIQARRQARAEAREIRLKEIERQQREEEEKQKAQQQGIDSSKYRRTKVATDRGLSGSLSSYSGSRRGSNDSTESDVSSKDSKDPKDQARQLKGQLRELEEKYKAAVVTNAQLDNVKTSHVFQVELLKEQLEEQEEAMIEVQREYKDKCRDYELLKRDFEALKLECDGIKHQIEVKDKLLKESGLVIVTSDEGELSLTKCASMDDVPIPDVGTAIISEEAADMLKRAGEGTLDDKLKKILAEQKSLQDEINEITKKLDEERNKKDPNAPKANTMNGPEQQLYEIQREASKQIHEYKLKLQKAEQEITNLEGTVNRLETQVKRFKYDAEEAERLEEELKSDRRRLQRELRECQNQIEELQNQNKHLTKRLEKIRQTRSALGVNT